MWEYAYSLAKHIKGYLSKIWMKNITELTHNIVDTNFCLICHEFSDVHSNYGPPKMLISELQFRSHLIFHEHRHI